MKYLLIYPYSAKKPDVIDVFKKRYPVLTIRQFLGKKCMNMTYAFYDESTPPEEADKLMNNVDHAIYYFSPVVKDKKYENDVFNVTAKDDFKNGYKTIYLRPDLYKLMVEMKKHMTVRQIFDRLLNFYEVTIKQIGATYIQKHIFTKFCNEAFNESPDYFYNNLTFSDLVTNHTIGEEFYLKPILMCEHKDRPLYYDITILSQNPQEQAFNIARIFKHFVNQTFDWSTIPPEQSVENYWKSRGQKRGGARDINILSIIIFIVILLICLFYINDIKYYVYDPICKYIYNFIKN